MITEDQRAALVIAVRDRSRAMGTARAVLFVLATYADALGGNVFPSTMTIANGAGLARSTAITALHKLELLGEIERVGTRGRGPRRTIVYRITLPETDRPRRLRADEADRDWDRRGPEPQFPAGRGVTDEEAG